MNTGADGEDTVNTVLSLVLDNRARVTDVRQQEALSVSVN